MTDHLEPAWSADAEQRATLDDVAWPIHTERLTLRRALQQDDAAVFAYRSKDVVAQWLSARQDDRAQWAKHWQRRLPTAIVVQRGGELIGDLRLVIKDAEAQLEVMAAARGVEAELGWAFDPGCAGQGYATEAVTALVRLAFSDLQLRRLTARCYADNEASWRLMERLGMRREARTVASTLHRDGRWRDFLAYGLIAPGL